MFSYAPTSFQEIHASHVESTLLSQVRVTKIGQEIDVWVLGRTRVRLRVGTYAPTRCCPQLTQASTVGLVPQSKGDVLLLTTDTEVSISPKLHRSRPTPSSSRQANGVTPGIAGPSNSGTQHEPVPTPKTHSQILRVVPSRVINIPLPSFTGPESVGYVSPSTWAQIYPETPTPSPASTRMYHSATVKRLRPPLDPTPSTASTSAAPPVAKVLNAGDKGLNKVADDAGKDPGKVYIATMDGIPASHVVFPDLVENVEEWDLVRSEVAYSYVGSRF